MHRVGVQMCVTVSCEGHDDVYVWSIRIVVWYV